MLRRPLSRNLDSPVQTQMAVSVLSNPFRTDYHSSGNRSEVKPTGRRRVFVQTDTGCVLGLELDRSDNAHTVKRKLQLALNVPTDESSLTFGDMVLKNDLSHICNDAPLLLKRNMMHRSSSTPCLSPTGKDIHPQPRDRSGPVEIIGCSTYCPRTRQLVKDVVKAINNGVDPVAVHSGLGGAYYFRNTRGESVAIVKPTDEEPFAPNNPKGFVGKALGQPGLKRSVRVGETGFREVAAYLLDYDHFANVPPTILVKITHSVFNVNDVNGCGNSKSPEKQRKAVSKIASFQQFIQHDFDASDYGTSSFPVAAVHRIGILDIRIFNTDRHGGNLLVRKVGDSFGGLMELIPIDHGLCLPEALEDPYFEWIHWPQSSIPFSEEELEYIANLDPVKDSAMLRRELPMIREACLRVLVVCTIFLKEAADFGLCLAEIGEMMSREFKGVEEEPSELEVICMEVKRLIGEREASPRLSDVQIGEDEEFLFDLDCEDDDYDLFSHRVSPTSHFGFRGGSNGRNPLSKLEESLEEEEDDGTVQQVDDDRSSILSLGHAAHAQALPLPPPPPRLSAFSKLSVSLNSVGLHDKCQQKFQTKAGGSLMGENHSDSSSISGSSISTNSSFSINSSSNNNSSWGLQGRSGRSANEQLPGSASFVKLADMGEDEWAAFLEKFQELLPAAFRDRKCTSTGYRQRQRLGTSCQF